MSRARDAWGRSREHVLAFLAYGALGAVCFFGVLLAWWVQTRPVNVPVPWPHWEELKETVYKDRVLRLADVGWNVGIIESGYEPFPRDGTDPYAGQHNWAYFPLTIWLSRIVRIVTRDGWWALQIVSLAAFAGFMTLARAMRKQAQPSGTWPMAHELLLLFFVLPITWPCSNMTVLPMLAEYALFFAALHLAREGEAPSRFAIGLVVVLAPIVAFSRPQGLVIDTLVGAALFFHLRAPLKIRIGVTAALAASVVAVFLWYKLAIGEPLAWYHVQKAWGRKTSMPWTLWYDELKSGFPFNGYASYALIGLRALLCAAGIGWAARAVLRERKDARPETWVEAWLIATTALVLVLPYTTGTIMGGHRYLCFAMYPFLAAPEKNLATRFPMHVFFALVFVRVIETAFLFQGAYFAIW